MYFTFGWPKILRIPEGGPGSPVSQVVANRDKIIFAVLTHSTLSIWTSKPCLPVVSHQRSTNSIEKLGRNVTLIWKPDSTSIVIVTGGGYLLFYCLGTGNQTLYEQVDSDNKKLKRESDELFLKEPIPAITLQLVQEIAVRGRVVGCAALFRDELMVSTDENHILRYRWDGSVNSDFAIDLRRIPFSLDQHASRAIPILEQVYPIDFHYSPLVGGFSLVLSDGRAAFLNASTKAYDPNSIQGIWAPGVEDAMCSAVNHKYRLLSFGRASSQVSVFCVDDTSGALQLLFTLRLSSKDFPGSPGAVKTMAWTPDGCAMAVSWDKGGFALWSVFGSLLTSSWSWTGDVSPFAQNTFKSFDWAAEGYQLWMAVEGNTSEMSGGGGGLFASVSFVKSSLTVNPSMSQVEHLYLQGEDRLLINFSGEGFGGPQKDSRKGHHSAAPLGNNKNWVVVPIPNTYLAPNWPIRYTAMDSEGLHIGVSGRFGLAHYSIVERKWHLFGNEAQERDFVVVGGMMWWEGFLVVAVYDIGADRDEIRFYPRDAKLDRKNALVKRLPSQILLLSLDRDKLLVFAADSTLAIFQLRRDLKDVWGAGGIEPCECLQTIDIGALCVHPACVISVYLTTLKTSFSPAPAPQEHSVVLNVSGRLMILHHEFLVQENTQGNAPQYITPTVLASCVEMVWLPRGSASSHNPYLSEALWLYCGQEMRVWLPLREKSHSSIHTFISNRIMLGFPVSIYPLTILFEKAIILGAENDSLSYTVGAPSPDSIPYALFPFCILQRTSQVYLHQILRQLIRRNLGYYAWEIARSCSKLPYFPHSLELLLHEVLEEEATSKDPIPDALLPSVLEFVREFPVYLRAVGQCARKTELALWPHLFSAAGRPRALFDECLARGQLDIAATYLLVIQNLESPTVSRKFAIQLMDRALEARKWDLVNDLSRFLKAIDPSDVDPPRSSVMKFNMASPPVSPSEYDISMVLGTMQVPRVRSSSTGVVPRLPEHKELGRSNSESQSRGSIQGHPSPNSSSGAGNSPGANSGHTQLSSVESKEIQQEPSVVYVDAIVESHARKILGEGRLRDLGRLAAHLDFHLVTWLRKEKIRRSTFVTDFVSGLKMIHEEFAWPWPDFRPAVGHSRTPSSESVALPLSEATSPLKPLLIEVRSGKNGPNGGGDSGYNSTPGNVPIEARLFPSPNNLDDSLSVLSEESHMCDGASPFPSSEISTSFGDKLVPEIQKMSIMNSSKTGIELRFLQQIMWEAGGLDWSLIISIALRDALGVVRTVNASRDATPEVLRNLRDGLLALSIWSNTQCLGYEKFIGAVSVQVSSLLNKFLSASMNASLNDSTHPAELNRRKTEPNLGSKPAVLALARPAGPPPASFGRKLSPRASVASIGSISSILESDDEPFLPPSTEDGEEVETPSETPPDPLNGATNIEEQAETSSCSIQ